MIKVINKKIKTTTNQYKIWESKIKVNNQINVWEQIQLKNATKSVMIIPINPVKEIIYIKKYCAASNTYELVLPGGKLDNNFNINQTIQKELIEETGFESKKITPLGPFKILPAYFIGTTYGFIAEQLSRSKKFPFDKNEVQSIKKLTITQSLNQIKSQKIRDCRTVALILYLNQYYKKILN